MNTKQNREAEALKHLETALGGNMNFGSLRPEAVAEIMQDFADKQTEKLEAKCALLLDVARIEKFTAEGYAGMRPIDGRIVDRRIEPDAIPMQKNTLLGIPEPKETDETRIVRPSIEKTREAAHKDLREYAEAYLCKHWETSPEELQTDLILYPDKERLIYAMLDFAQSCQGHQCPDQSTDTRKFTKEEILEAYEAGDANGIGTEFGSADISSVKWFNQKYGE